MSKAEKTQALSNAQKPIDLPDEFWSVVGQRDLYLEDYPHPDHVALINCTGSSKHPKDHAWALNLWHWEFIETKMGFKMWAFKTQEISPWQPKEKFGPTYEHDGKVWEINLNPNDYSSGWCPECLKVVRKNTT